MGQCCKDEQGGENGCRSRHVVDGCRECAMLAWEVELMKRLLDRRVNVGRRVEMRIRSSLYREIASEDQGGLGRNG